MFVVIAALAGLTLLTTPGAAQIAPGGVALPPCVGDCDGNTTITINELILGVEIALGNTELGECPAFDSSGDGRVQLNELIVTVNGALSGCIAVSPTPTPTDTPPSPSPTETATATGTAVQTATTTLPVTPPTASTTATPLATETPSPTSSTTPTATPSGPTATTTQTGTITHTGTATETPSSTLTPSSTGTATLTSTITRTPSRTLTGTRAMTGTRTATGTRTMTGTRTPSASATASRTRTPTRSTTATRTGTGTRTATPTHTSLAPTRTRTPSRTQTATRTATLSPTITPTFPIIGPTITYMGVARADGQPVPTVGVLPDGTRIFERRIAQGFFLVVEAREGESRLPVGTTTFNHAPADPNRLPNLQIVASRPLGNGSAAVCDDGPSPPPGGVPGVDPPVFGGSQASANAVNDLACRFNARVSIPNEGVNACTRNAFQEPAFVSSQSRVQFCPVVGIGSELAFQPGDTRITARVTDTAGNPGQTVSIILRYVP